jgi:hypothetical protein
MMREIEITPGRKKKIGETAAERWEMLLILFCRS